MKVIGICLKDVIVQTIDLQIYVLAIYFLEFFCYDKLGGLIKDNRCENCTNAKVFHKHPYYDKNDGKTYMSESVVAI